MDRLMDIYAGFVKTGLFQ